MQGLASGRNALALLVLGPEVQGQPEAIIGGQTAQVGVDVHQDARLTLVGLVLPHLQLPDAALPHPQDLALQGLYLLFGGRRSRRDEALERGGGWPFAPARGAGAGQQERFAVL
ncbi:MAG: hypothetical protein C4525_02310 [Desulfarculus sp.]|nr:MAG: hypothetical protein C4525_02310 [Desulfarculus sp.]